MEIKTSLKQLGKFFAQSAATEELTLPVRRFAAQLTILTAHIQRIEATAKRVTEDLEKRIEAFEAALRTDAPSEQVAAPGSAPSGQEQSSEEQPDEESEAEAMAAKVQAETEAELAAITNGAAEPEVVVMPTTRKNGGKKPSQVGA